MKLEKIKQLRERSGMSQAKLAEILEMQVTQYRRYENGERVPPIDFIIKLADFYGVSLDYIAGRADETPKAKENIG